MVVLKFDPTRAPDFSATSDILKNAGLSLSRAFDSAGSLLSSYQEGAQEKVDNEVFSEIVGLDQEGLQSYLDNNGLKGRNISKNLRDRIGKKFGVIADVANTRQRTVSAAATTAINQASEGRVAAENTFQLGRRAASTGNAQLELAADREARGLPTGAPPGAVDQIRNAIPDTFTVGGVPTVGDGSRAPRHLVGTESGGNFQAKNESVGSGGVKGHDGRVQAGAARLTDAKNAGVIPKGMTREEFRNDPKAQVAFENWHFDDIDKNIEKNGYSKYIGTTINGVEVTHQGMADVQHIGGATGLKKFLESNGKYNKQDDNKTSLTDYLRNGGIATAEAANAITASQPESQPDPLDGLRAIGDPAGLGETGILGPKSPEERLAEAEAAGIQPVATPPVPQSTSAQEALDRANRDNPFITGPELVAQDARLRGAGDEATARSEKARAKKVATQTASEIIKQVSILSNQTQESVVAGVYQASIDAGLTPQEAIASAERAAVVATGALAGVISPKITGDKVLDSIIANEGAIANAALEALPIDRLTKNAKKYAAATTVTQGLVASLNIHRDGEDTSSRFWTLIGEDGTDDKILTTHLNEIARLAGVTPQIAAAAMFEEFIRDPFWTNTVAKRFPKEKILAYLELNMSPSAVAIYQSDVQRNLNREQELVAGQLRLDILRISLKKAEAQGRTTKVTEIEESIASLRGTLLTGSTPREGELALSDYISPQGINMSAQLAKLDPDSQAHRDLVGLIVLKIQGDPYKSEPEKAILIAAIKS